MRIPLFREISELPLDDKVRQVEIAVDSISSFTADPQLAVKAKDLERKLKEVLEEAKSCSAFLRLKKIFDPAQGQDQIGEGQISLG